MHLRHQWSSSSPLLRPQSEPGAPPLAYGLSTRPQLASEPSKSQLPALCFTQNPNPTFPPNIFTLRSQSHRQDDPVECNGVGEGHAQYSATRNSMKRRAADGKLLSSRVIHENESGPTPTKPTPPRFICALHVPEPKLTDTWTSMGYPSVGHSLGWKVMFTKNIFKRIDFLRFYFYLCHMSDILYLSFKQH